jgi:predicted phosphodiesterase
MMKRPTTTDLARQYANRHRSTPTRTLARMLLKDAPEVYRDYEHARGAVRDVRGERGKRARKTCHKAIVPTDKHRFTMPTSDAKPVEPVKLDLYGKGLIAGDWHIPYHDQQACELAVNHAIDKGYTDFLLINGDFLDAYSLSRWEKDPRKRRFKDELAVGRETLEGLTSVFDRVVYKFGNHEVRYESYLRQRAPELLDIDEFNWRSILHADRIGFETVGANNVIQAGGVNILHGHEYVFSMQNPVNPARGLFLRAKASALCGHFHQSSEHNESDIRGKHTACWSLGALCDLHPEYMPLNKWNHGGALAELSEDRFSIDSFRIIKGGIV